MGAGECPFTLPANLGRTVEPRLCTGTGSLVGGNVLLGASTSAAALGAGERDRRRDSVHKHLRAIHSACVAPHTQSKSNNLSETAGGKPDRSSDDKPSSRSLPDKRKDAS